MSYELGNLKRVCDPGQLGAVPRESWANPATGHGGTGPPPADEIRTGNLQRHVLPGGMQIVWVPPSRTTIKKVVGAVGKAIIPAAAVMLPFVPGVAPLIGKAAVGAGKLASKAIKAGAGLIPHGRAGVPAPGTDFIGPPAPGPSIPSGPSIPFGPSVQSEAGGMAADFIGPPAPSPTDAGAPEQAGAAKPSGLNPLVIVGAGLALLMAFSSKPSARRY